jgi:hypothetical protein
MKSIKKCSMFLLLAVFAMACETQMVDQIDIFSFEQGGYMRTISPFVSGAAVSTFNISKANLAGTKMEIVAEAITPDRGALFQSYDLSIRFVDTTPANGTNTTTAVALKSIPASAYAKDPVTGYPRATISVTGAEAVAATKVAEANMTAGDRFEITGVMRLTNGKSFTAANSSGDIVGGAFYSSPFFYRLAVQN